MKQFWQERKRRRLLKRSDSGPFQDCLTAPLIALNRPVIETDFLVLDFETTGLDPKSSHVLSVGFIEISGGRIALASGQHYFVRYDEQIPDHSVAVHLITEEKAAQGEPIKPVLDHLLNALAGKVLVAHYSPIELNFLGRLCDHFYGARLPLSVVDTLEVEHRRRVRRSGLVSSNELRLFNLRDEYRLPRYRAHDAFVDALSTAELFLAQVHRYAGGLDAPVGDYTL